MNDYNMCQVTYREKCKERIQRQLAISKDELHTIETGLVTQQFPVGLTITDEHEFKSISIQIPIATKIAFSYELLTLIEGKSSWPAKAVIIIDQHHCIAAGV